MRRKSHIKVKRTDGTWCTVEEKNNTENVKVHRIGNEHVWACKMSEEEKQRLEKRAKILESKGSKVLCHKNGKWVVKSRRPGGTNGGGGAEGVKPDEYKGVE